MMGRAKTLRAVFNHRQAMPCRYRVDGRIIRHLPEQTHRQNRFRARGDHRLDSRHVDIENLYKKARKAISRLSVPLATVMQCFTPTYSASAASSSVISGPMMYWPW